MNAHSPPSIHRRAPLCPLLVCLFVLTTFPAPVSAQSPYPEQDGFVANGSDVTLSLPRVQSEFDERLGEPYGVDGIAIIVDNCEPDPELYLDGALQHYGLSFAPGKMYDDSLAWLICSQPRYVGFFYAAGLPWAEEFDRLGAADMVTQAMAERLAAGNFTGALTVGVGETVDLIEQIQREAADAGLGYEDAGLGSGEQVPLGTSDGGASASEPSAENDSSGSMAGQLATAGALGLGGLWLWRRRRREDESAKAKTKPEAASSPAQSPRAQLEAKMKRLDARLGKGNQALARLVLAYRSIGEEAMLQVSRRHDTMLARKDLLRNRLADLPQAPASGEGGGASPDGQTSQTAAPLSQALAAADAEAEELLAYVDEIESEADHVEMLEERAAVLTVEARKAIAAAGSGYADLLAQLEVGSPALPEVRNALDVPTALAEEAERVLATGDRITAGRLAEDAATLAVQTIALLDRALATDDRIEAGVLLFERVEAYAEANWADIRGNGSEAEESLEAGLTMLARILAATPADFGADVAAGYMASLERVAAELNRAEQLIQAIGERLERLDRARIGAVDQVEAVRADIQRARTWLADSAVADDVDAEPELELSRAEALLDELVQGMSEAQPDWLAITRNIHTAAGKVEAAMAEARRQDARADALRRHWESARDSAMAALDRALQYLALHRADLPADSASQLEAARAEMLRAEAGAREAEGLVDQARADRLEEAVRAAEAADQAADTAYETMAAAVAKADRSRDYVPRPDWIGPSVPFPMTGRRSIHLPDLFDLGPIKIGTSPGPLIRPSRPSSWGSRPRPSTRPGGGGRVSRPKASGGSRPSSSRRGGGRGW